MIDYKLIKEIYEARKKYDKVFFLDVADGVVYRQLTEAEFAAFDSLAKKFSPILINDLIVEKACVYIHRGLDWMLNNSPAGLVDHIADSILTSSKFKNAETIDNDIEEAKKRIDYTLSDSVHVISLNMFPNIRKSELKNMSYDELVSILAKASLISTGKSPDDSSVPQNDILSPRVADRLIK